MKRFLFPLFLSCLPVTFMSAQTVDGVVFTLEDGAQTNNFDIRIAIGGSTTLSDDTKASGTVTSSVVFDGGVVTGLAFASGDVSFSNTSFEGGNIVARYDLEGTDIGGTVTTPNGPAPVAANGMFDSALHLVTVDQGAVTGTARTLLGNQEVDFPFATDPFSAPGEGMGTLTAVEQSQDDDSITYLLTLDLPVSLSREVMPDGIPITATTTIQGQVRATATAVVPKSVVIPVATAFATWAQENNLPVVDPLARCLRADLPDGLIFALGRNRNDAAPLFTTGSNGGLMLAAPMTGLRAPVVLEQGTSLEDFAPAAPGNIVGSESATLPAGFTGEVMIAAPAGATRSFSRARINPADFMP